MKKLCFYLLLLSVMAGCKEEYDARVNSLDKSFLVVEGNMDPGSDSTTIRLTRTLKLDDRLTIKNENGALIFVQGKDNSVRQLTFVGSGYYRSPNLNLLIGNEYRLRIRTIDGKEYLSEYVRAKQTPPIDSISWGLDSRGAVVYANTHDPSAQTIYYRWDYNETWEIHSKYLSYYVYDPIIRNVRPRIVPGELVYECWKYDTSSSIPLANSANLSQDVIYKAPLVHIPFGDDRLSVRYSIYVTQYALDKDAYDFFELMKRNTEQIGSIFSPQPSELTGNIHCITDPEEYVLGHITASTVDRKRVFIQMPWQFSMNCETVEVPNSGDKIMEFFSAGGFIPYSFSMTDNKYYGSTAECVDCRLRRGSTTKPSFW